MKIRILFIVTILALFACKKNEYLDASIDKPTVEFSTTELTETISFISNGNYDIAVPIQIFGGTTDKTISVSAKTALPNDAYSLNSTLSLTKGQSIDTIHISLNTSKIQKGKPYNITLTITSNDIAVSENYKTCDIILTQQTFMDFFTGKYSCYESATNSTYEVDFEKIDANSIKNNNFWDFPLPGQYVTYIFAQDETFAISIPEDSEWTDNLGNKYLVSGSGTYDLQGNFTVNYVMKNASTGTTYQTGTHTFKKKAQ